MCRAWYNQTDSLSIRLVVAGQRSPRPAWKGLISINKSYKGTVALLAASIIWGLAFSAQSTAMKHIPPITFVFLRSTITCLVLAAAAPLFARLSGSHGEETPPLSVHIRRGVPIGAFLMAATLLQQVGLVYTTPAKSGFVTALYIVMVPLLGLLFHRPVGRLVWVGVALSLTGLVLLCVQEDMSVNIGDLFTLGSALMFSCQIMLVAKHAPGLDAVKLSAVQFGTCAVLAGLLALFMEAPTLSGVIAGLPSLIYVAVMSGAVGYTLQIVGQKSTDPTLASLLMCLESVFAAIGGWLLLHQALSPRELAGCALMLAASVVAQLPDRRRA